MILMLVNMGELNPSFEYIEGLCEKRRRAGPTRSSEKINEASIIFTVKIHKDIEVVLVEAIR